MYVKSTISLFKINPQMIQTLSYFEIIPYKTRALLFVETDKLYYRLLLWTCTVIANLVIITTVF